MNFFEKIALKKTDKSISALHFPEINFYSINEFNSRVALEKRRSERINLHSSLITLYLEFDEFTNSFSFAGVDIKTMIRTILLIVRETDAVTQIKYEKVLILLPDTDKKGAQFVCASLINQLMNQRISNHAKNKLSSENFKIEIQTFPERIKEKNVA